MPTLRSNRTFMELKFFIKRENKIAYESSNRTFMELKLLSDQIVCNLFICFNCTFMELKLNMKGIKVLKITKF